MYIIYKKQKSLIMSLTIILQIITAELSLADESINLYKKYSNNSETKIQKDISLPKPTLASNIISGTPCPENDKKVIKIINDIRYHCQLDPSKNQKGKWGKGVDVSGLKDITAKFNYNFHKSIPNFWQIEFKKIINNLSSTLPLPKELNQIINGEPIKIYAWHTIVNNPFKEISERRNIGYSYNNTQGLVITFEMPKHSFDKDYKYMGRYAIIAHEYFHLYQIALSGIDNQPKWLYEGAASLFEELYVQQYYKNNDLKYNLTSIHPLAKSKPELYEKIETSNLDIEGKPMDKAYSGSTYLVLTLINQLKKSGMSEVEAYRRVLKKFPQNDYNNNWEIAFKETFNLSVEEFYAAVIKDRPLVVNILPSKNLKIKDIFTTTN